MIELRKRRLAAESQVPVIVQYDGHIVGEHRLDLVVERTIVVELKAIKDVEQIHFAVTRSYLNAIRLEHGLILNFGAVPLQIKRVHA